MKKLVLGFMLTFAVLGLYAQNITVTGIGGMFGALGGILLSLLVQKNLFVHYRAINQIETAYYIMFAWCASAYILAWLIMHLLVPKVNVIED
jgi:ACS family hexuronate transporter-like MFS transporter